MYNQIPNNQPYGMLDPYMLLQQNEMNFVAMKNYYEQQLTRCDITIKDLYARLSSFDSVEVSGEHVESDAEEDRLYYTVQIKNNGSMKRSSKKQILKGLPKTCIYIQYDEKFDLDDKLCIIWGNGKQTYISAQNPDAKAFINSIITTGASKIESSDTYQNTFRRMLLYIQSEEVEKAEYTVYYNPGWYKGNDNKTFFYYFPDGYKPDNPDIRSSGLFNNRLFADEQRSAVSNAVDIIKRLEVFKNVHGGLIMIIFLVYSVLQHFFRDIKYFLDMILLLTGNASCSNSVAMAFIQIYNTPSSAVLTLSDNKTILQALYNHKDDTIIFAEKKYEDKRAHEAKNLLLDIIASNSYQKNGSVYQVESLVAVIAETFALERTDADRFITFNIEDSDIDESKLVLLDDREVPTFVMYFTQYISEENLNLKERIEAVHSDKKIKMLRSASSKKLYIILKICADIFFEYILKTTGRSFLDLSGIEDDKEIIIFDFVKTNERYSAIQDACETFGQIITDLIENDKCKLIDNTGASFISNPAGSKNFPVVFVDKSYVYISEQDMKQYLHSIKENNKFFNLYLTALKKYGYLNCNYTKFSARPIIRYPGKSAVRKKMLAIRRELLGEIDFNL